MRLVQFIDRKGAQEVGAVGEDANVLQVLFGVNSTYELALAAARAGHSLESEALSRIGMLNVDYDDVVMDHRLLPPLTHPDPYHCLITGTGLSHLGDRKSTRLNSSHQ